MCSSERKAMLLAIDCGNTNTVFSIWDGERFLCHLAHCHRSQAHGG
jgi:pantothenate kinase type III